MKTIPFALILFLTSLAAWAQLPPGNVRHLSPRASMLTNAPFAPGARPGAPGFQAPLPGAATPATVANPAAANMAAAGSAAPAAPAAPAEEMVPAGYINFQGVDVNQVLDVYAKLVGRTILRAGLPGAQIVLRTETPLTKSEAIQALQAVLALNGVSLINVGDKFVKAVPSDQAGGAGGDFNDQNEKQMPELGSYVTRIVQLKYVKPSEMVPVIQPFARLNSIIPLDPNGILVIRDYTENVKRMLEMIDKVDVSVPEEYISEVIPIKYALADDIASALNSLGGSGGSTVSIGASSAAPTVSGIHSGGMSGISGMGGAGGMGGMGGVGGMGGMGGTQTSPYNQGTQQRPFGTTTPNGTPATGTTFQQRLQSIIQRAATGGGQQQQQIQVFGQAKIIADERSNSLLIFATRDDMERIKAVVAKLDVLLSQVLIESIIMDVSLNNGWNFGVSAEQNPKNFSPSVPVAGGGGYNNGQPFANFLNNAASLAGTNVVSGLSSGFSYFGNIGPTWDLALQAAAQDSSVSIIQRPRIQTSQAKPASFFVGNTVPYITSSYGGYGGYGYGNSFSQLSVGVELDVTPFINPDGLVVMDINQEIDDINGYTAIAGVGNVPNTDKRTLSSEIAVKDRDTIILGGFVRSEKDKTRTGVPLLQDIPILGNLFSSKTANKTRSELIVLMRPTVLRTPDIAAAQTIEEQQRLPGISAAAAEDRRSERALVEQERRREMRDVRYGGQPDGFYTPVPPPSTNVNALPGANP